MKYKIPLLLMVLISACGEKRLEEKKEKTKTMDKVRLITLDPGHFHAALVQNRMYDQVDSTIHVFAPEGPEVRDFLDKIDSYNQQKDHPTAWQVQAHLGEGYFEDMLSERPGNVVVISGKNSKKVDYILEAVRAGLHVYADKPLVIDSEGFEKLKLAFEVAERNKVLIYDIMTERFEITTIMQKLFSTIPEVFGTLVEGTADDPAISKESVHHFSKIVSGKPLVRPPWFFDIEEEGEGIVDVTTHLVDLVQWEAFPGQVIDTSNIEMIRAKRWPTILTLKEFQKVTGLDAFPEFLEKDIKDGKLQVYSNGEMDYTINGIHAKVSVIWNFEAPEGTGDTHYSVMRGTRSDLIIKQGKEENYRPVLYIASKGGEDFEVRLQEAIAQKVAVQYPGTTAKKVSDTLWELIIPENYKIGHEAHFGQVTENFLKYLEDNKLPEWEVPNMVAKYYTTIEALKRAKGESD